MAEIDEKKGPGRPAKQVEPETSHEDLTNLEPEAKSKEEPEAKSKEEREAKGDVLKYEKFAILHHLMYNGNSGKFEKKLLKPEALEEYEELEQEIKSWKGKKPKKSATVYVSGMAKAVKIVEGYALPNSLMKDIETGDSAILGLYF